MNRNKQYHVPERFLRQLWKHRQFDTSNLRTTDGQSVEIVSTGKLNRDGGPDFVGASIRVGGTLYTGDVEIHQHNNEWIEHEHHHDPKYNSVVLHVVLHGDPAITPPVTESGRTIPILVLEDSLIASYRTTWESMILNERAERLSTIACYDRNESIDPSIVRKWLEKLAVERIELKVRRFEERLKELVDEGRFTVKEPPPKYDEIPFGINPDELPPPSSPYTQSDFRKSSLWEQLLYEGAMEALGYSKNQQSFLKIARNARLKLLSDLVSNATSGADQTKTTEAILFGMAGLLPAPHGEFDGESKYYLRDLRSVWKERMASYHGECLDEAEWQFFRLRPDNFPTVRLAGAARLLQKLVRKTFFKSIIQTVKDREQKNKSKIAWLEEMFVVPADGFWMNHYRFGERTNKLLTTLVGRNRADDIILNVVVPISFLYARIFKDKDARQGTLKLLQHCPPLSRNTVTNTIEQQVIKGRFDLDSAMLQQGALQLYKFYCVDERCSECAVGKAVPAVS